MGSEGRYSFRFSLGSPADLAAGRVSAKQQDLPLREIFNDLWQRIWSRPG